MLKLVSPRRTHLFGHGRFRTIFTRLPLVYRFWNIDKIRVRRFAPQTTATRPCRCHRCLSNDGYFSSSHSIHPPALKTRRSCFISLPAETKRETQQHVFAKGRATTSTSGKRLLRQHNKYMRLAVAFRFDVNVFDGEFFAADIQDGASWNFFHVAG
jgi:hypothetical protein